MICIKKVCVTKTIVMMAMMMIRLESKRVDFLESKTVSYAFDIGDMLFA